MAFDTRLGSKRAEEIHPIVQLMSLVEDVGVFKPMYGPEYDFNKALNQKCMGIPDKAIDALIVVILVLALASGKFGI